MPRPIATMPDFRHAIRLIAPLARRHWLRLVAGIIALLGVDLFQLLIPRAVRSAVDGLESGGIDVHGLWRQALLILALAAGVAVCRFSWRTLILGFSRLAEEKIRDRLVAHILTLDRAFFQRRSTGDLMALAANDMTSVQMLCGMGLIALVDAVVMTLAAIGFMVYIDPLLTLLALLPLPILAIATRVLSGRLHHHFSRVQQRFADLTESARRAITAIRLVKVNGREEDQARRFDREGRRYIEASLDVARVQGTLFPLSGAVANTSLLIIMLVGGRMAIAQRISLGDFVAFISYLFMLTWPMMAIGWVTNVLQRGLTSLERIGNIIDEPQVIPSEAHRVTCPLRAPIVCQGLDFTYPGSRRPTLRAIDLTIDRGIIGIAGPTGAGKTTLCHLLARLHPPTAGVITVGGRPAGEIPIADYLAQTAYAPQEPLLFSTTIAENIAFGRPESSPDEIEAAAKMAAIHDEISALPAGYATRIGEKGVRLSGGQRQRLALARALLVKARLLILDDPLSAVDTHTEGAICRALDAYVRAHDMMVVIVSHRLPPLLLAERVVIMDAGRITATGRHRELAAGNTFYQGLLAAHNAIGGDHA